MSSNKQKPRYWHAASNKEADAVFTDSKITVKEFMEKYSQPKWCSYPDALAGKMGCWSLTSETIRKSISPRFCKSCDCYIKQDKTKTA